MNRSNRDRLTILGKPATLITVALILTATYLVGGSSRADYLPSIFIVTISAGYVGALAPFVTKRQLRPIAVPLGMLGGVFLLCLGQLVPVHGLSTIDPSSPNVRQLIAATSGMAKLPVTWRPISLSPAATWSTLIALFVPVAMLIALSRLPAAARQFVLPFLLTTAFVSAIFGVLQSLSGAESALYYYEHTNRGEPVGVFANRNHQAIFVACGILWGAYVYRQPPSRPDCERVFKLTAAAMAIAMFCCVLANPSRAGLMALSLATIFAYILLTDRRTMQIAEFRTAFPSWQAPSFLVAVLRRLTLPVVTLLNLGFLSILFLSQMKIPAVERLVHIGSTDDLRSEVTPTLIDMAWRNFPWGTGMGTFERVYRTVEPDGLLMPSYLNNAHNDWLQLVIEGGLPAVLLLGCSMVWIGSRLIGLWRLKGASTSLAICVSGTLVILMVASLVDYPLRTPWMMAVVALLVGLLGFEKPTDQANGQALRKRANASA